MGSMCLTVGRGFAGGAGVCDGVLLVCAAQAFEAGALDYLLKPFDNARFELALRRARNESGRGVRRGFLRIVDQECRGSFVLENCGD